MPPPAGCLPFHRNRACPIRREANVRAHQVSCPAPGRRRLRPCPGHLAASWPADRGPQPAAGHAGRGWGDRSTWRRSRRGESLRRRRLCGDQVPDSRHDLGGLVEICTTEGSARLTTCSYCCSKDETAPAGSRRSGRCCGAATGPASARAATGCRAQDHQGDSRTRRLRSSAARMCRPAAVFS